MTERGQHMLKHTVLRSLQLSAESIAKDLQAQHPRLTAPSAMQSVGCSGIKYAATGF
ncbi:unnamed protein product [Staurois parvus]|uniref:Uncharacterized protein n=1 Tax=Staurois parvus TaxID=386267 RepID=A0ABN9H066_9NEOB|nr:unnamed protein product [Staurois parvus]